MSTVTFQLPEATVDRLTDAARELHLPLENLLQRIADEYLNRKGSFEDAASYVLRKNAELYRRLAQ